MERPHAVTRIAIARTRPLGRAPVRDVVTTTIIIVLVPAPLCVSDRTPPPELSMETSLLPLSHKPSFIITPPLLPKQPTLGESRPPKKSGRDEGLERIALAVPVRSERSLVEDATLVLFHAHPSIIVDEGRDPTTTSTGPVDHDPTMTTGPVAARAAAAVLDTMTVTVVPEDADLVQEIVAAWSSVSSDVAAIAVVGPDPARVPAPVIAIRALDHALRAIRTNLLRVWLPRRVELAQLVSLRR